MFETIRADLVRFPAPGTRHQQLRWSSAAAARTLASELGAWAGVEYRFRRWTRTVPGPAGVVLRVAGLFTRKVVEITTGISIAGRARFGPGLYIGHFGGITVGPEVVVGENCNLSQGVTLGDHAGSPVIGDCCYLAPGAVVFGPVTVGDHVAIGANAVVQRDVPSRCTATGVPVRIIEGRGNLI